MPGGLPVYKQAFGRAQAERLLWRAGFGPRPGEARALTKLGLDGAVEGLLDPPAFASTGPAPSDRGFPIAPNDAFGHDHLWWLVPGRRRYARESAPGAYTRLRPSARACEREGTGRPASAS
jgi:hypothetical protein